MIEKNLNEVLLKKDPLALTLINKIITISEKNEVDDLSLYHQFPFYRDATGDELIVANILIASKSYGIVIFQCLSDNLRNQDISVYLKRQTEHINSLDTEIFSKLIKSELLKKDRRDLKFAITPAFYSENDGEIKMDSDIKIIVNDNDLESLFKTVNIGYNKLTDQEYSELKAILEGSKVIPKKAARVLKEKNVNPTSKGAILSRIENEIANFDSEQKKAALFTLDGPQRIRGLAGSGKTIILAMKAALIHIQEPNAEILYTYYTKALNDYVKKLITRFYRQYSEKDPNWEKIHIMHAWGGRSLEGVYYNSCKLNSIPPINLREAKYKSAIDPFSFVCGELIKNDLEIQYDYSLLDEAQDFPKSFYRLCRKITKKNRVIWAYDDFQNILDVELQNEKETFGKNSEGEYYIDFSNYEDELHDIILHKCYRNPRRNLLAAFALGLGIYNDNGQVLQRLENNEHWRSLGFTVEKGDSKEGDQMVISRPAENSPLLKNELLEENILKIKTYSDLNSECADIVNMIRRDLESDLLPEDIAVISLDNRHVRSYFDEIGKLLEGHNLKYFSLLDAPTENTIYKIAGHITLSTIFKAKGNESGSVYVCGVDAVFANKNSIIERNKLFTAITRSEGWVTLTGMKTATDKCIEELTNLKNNDFKLIFKQPSKESTKTIYREISRQQEKLNQMERIAEELKKMGISEDELKEKLLNLVLGKK